MSAHDWAWIVYELSSWAVNSWCWAGLVIMMAKLVHLAAPKPVAWWFLELKPFYLYLFGVAVATEAFLSHSLFNRLLYAGCALFNWFLYRNIMDGDDRWKRRKRKLAEKVSRVGARLSVVPVGGGA